MRTSAKIWTALGGAWVLFAAIGTADELRPWPAYRTAMWVGNSAYKQPAKVELFFQRMREMGINAATAHASASAQPILAQRFPFYVENVVNRGLCLKFNSKVRDWPAFIADWTKNGRPESALVRDYCLDDPEWLDAARGQMRTAALRFREHAPFAIDIRDELSTTISANPFDYDFAPLALAGFRAWLQTQYRDLAALNREWETQFAAWADVRPFTTDQIKNRMASGEARPRGQPDWQALRRLKFDPAAARAEATRWNFAPWADFRTYMDISLARALDALRRASHEVDPRTPVGIEGTQMPSAFGGYDLWRLAQVLDWVEPYDIGDARAIFGSFMPGKPILTTVFEKETHLARRRLWHLLLEGDRGCVIWWSEDCIDWQSEDYALTSKGRALAPVLRELQSPLAALFLRARREVDPIHVVYSQPSIQVNWLLESIGDGATWMRRFSSHEARHNRMARQRGAWLKLIEDLGFTPQFVPAEKLAEIAGTAGGDGVLVLSEALALSDAEAAAAANFRQHPDGARTIVADAAAGVFDEHGRLRREPGALSAYAEPGAITVTRGVARPVVYARDIATYGRNRLQADAAEWTTWAAAQLAVSREIVVPPETHTRVHRYRLGAARLVAFERNIVYHMSEDLKQAGGNEPLEQPVAIAARLAQPAHVYDLRSGAYLGRTDRISFTLDPWQPSLFALLPEKLATGDVVAALHATP